jgi:pimeloyl-ACP methyl ester carboxylesterase
MDLYGIKIHYTDKGKGDVILLLHGVFSSLHTFNNWTNKLSENHRVIRVDLPGFGLTGPWTDNEYSINRYIEFIKEFMDKLDINKFHIAGSSLGGWIAWEFAVAMEHRIDKMILINSAGYINQGKYPWPFIIAKIPVLNQVFNFQLVPKFLARKILKEVIYDHRLISDELANRYYNLAKRKGNLKAFKTIANLPFKQNTDALQNISTPTLLLWGDNDAWISSKDAESFKSDLQNAKVIIYKEVGHIPMEEIPERSCKDALDFLLQ